jgi:hypothetical protein
MDLCSAARAVLAPPILGAVILGAVLGGAVGCAVAPTASVVRYVSTQKVSGTNPMLTQTGGDSYLSWDMSPARAGLPRMALARIDPRTGKIEARNTFSRGMVGAPLFAAGSLWVTDSAPLGELLLRLDPATLMVSGELSLSAARYPDGSHLTYAGGWLWADGGGSLLRVSPSSVEVTATVALLGAYRSSVTASADGSALVVTERGKTGQVREYCAEAGSGRIVSGLTTPASCG